MHKVPYLLGVCCTNVEIFMITNERELDVLREVYRQSLPDIAEEGLNYFYQLDKLNTDAGDWHQLSAHVHRLGVSCQLFEFDLLCELCFDLEFKLDKTFAMFQLNHLAEIESLLVQIHNLAKVTYIDCPVTPTRLQ